tara:strand:- start:2942 stop:5059 length:2118 start_codon:yes stop_codon:yes gene_type:complete
MGIFRSNFKAITAGLLALSVGGQAAIAENLQFVETAEVSKADLLQELVTIQKQAEIQLEHHRREALEFQSRAERLEGLQQKGYASVVEVREANLNTEKEELQANSFAAIHQMASEMVDFVSTENFGPASEQKPTLNLSLPTVTVDLAGIRLMGYTRPANEEFAEVAFDYLYNQQENARAAVLSADSDSRVAQWNRTLNFPGAHPAEIRHIQRKIANTETRWQLGGLDRLMIERDLQRLERFGRHLSLIEDGDDLPCAFPVLSQPLFLGAGENVLSLELNDESLALVLPVAAAMASHEGPVLVQESRLNDAERKLRWIKRAYDRGAASSREYDQAHLDSHIANEVLQGMKANLEAEKLNFVRLATLARERGLELPSEGDLQKELPSMEDLLTEIRTYREGSTRSTSVLLGLANRFQESALASAQVQATKLEKDWHQAQWEKSQKLTNARKSELERLESKFQQSTAKTIDATEKEQLRYLELQQWMKASELPSDLEPDSEISAEMIRLAQPVAEARVIAAQHYRSAREIDRDYRLDLLGKLDSLHQRGKARSSEVANAKQNLAISEGRLQSSEHHLMSILSEKQLIASLMDSTDANGKVNLAQLGGSPMQLIIELCHHQLRPDPGIIQELEARLEQVTTRRDKLAELAAKGYASNLEVTQMKEAVNHYTIALGGFQGREDMGKLRSELVDHGLQPTGLLPVSGTPAK